MLYQKKKILVYSCRVWKFGRNWCEFTLAVILKPVFTPIPISCAQALQNRPPTVTISLILPSYRPLFSTMYPQPTTPLSVCSSDITIWFKGHLPLGPHFLFRWRVKGLRRAGAVKDQLLPSSSHSQPLEDSLIVDRERRWHHPTPIWEVYCFNWLCLVQHTHSICTDLTA